MSDLQSDLTDIQGVGDATADKILDVLENHDMGNDDPLMAKARAAAAGGNDRDAAMYLRRASGDN